MTVAHLCDQLWLSRGDKYGTITTVVIYSYGSDVVVPMADVANIRDPPEAFVLSFVSVGYHWRHLEPGSG